MELSAQISDLLSQFPLPPSAIPQYDLEMSIGSNTNDSQQYLLTKSRSMPQKENFKQIDGISTSPRQKIRSISQDIVMRNEPPIVSETCHLRHKSLGKIRETHYLSRNSEHNLLEYLKSISNKEDKKFSNQTFDKLLHACRSDTISSMEYDAIVYILTQFDEKTVINALDNVQIYIKKLSMESKSSARKSAVFSKLKKKEEQPFITVSNFWIEFSGVIPLEFEVVEEITITSINHTAKFNFFAETSKKYDLTFSPKEGYVKKKCSQVIQIKLKAHTMFSIKQVITLEIEGGGRYFLIVKAISEQSEFGVDVDELNKTTDQGLKVPSILVTMKNYLKEHGGLQLEGIFRQQGDERVEKNTRVLLNRGSFTSCQDLYALANLIKVWFRELPTPILDILPIDVIAQESVKLEISVSLAMMLPEPNRSLLEWIVSLLSEVALLESQNSMNSKKLAVAIAPNLISKIEEPGQLISVVNFLTNLLENQVRKKKTPLT